MLTLEIFPPGESPKILRMWLAGFFILGYRVTVSLSKLLPLSQAAKKLALSEDELRAQIEAGTILAGILPNGEIVVNEASLQTPTKKEQLPEYIKHAHLQGTEISISEAGRKYEIPHTTLIKWMNAGYIKRLKEDGYRTFLDEADVAYCSEIYQQKRGQGKWLFNRDGTPYKAKVSQTSQSK